MPCLYMVLVMTGVNHCLWDRVTEKTHPPGLYTRQSFSIGCVVSVMGRAKEKPLSLVPNLLMLQGQPRNRAD